MKDITHHLRYVQKKIIQSVRKEESTPYSQQAFLTTGLAELESESRAPRKKIKRSYSPKSMKLA